MSSLEVENTGTQNFLEDIVLTKFKAKIQNQYPQQRHYFYKNHSHKIQLNNVYLYITYIRMTKYNAEMYISMGELNDFIDKCPFCGTSM